MSADPVALVTGASGVLGQAIALSFAKHGYAVGIHYESGKDRAKETKKKVEETGVPGMLLQADVRSSKEVEAMVRMVSVEWQRIDVLVNNAGISRNKPFMKMSEQEWRDVLDVNLSGAFHCMKAVFPLMKESRCGSVVNVTSYLARRPVFGAANYVVSKAGLISLTQCAALEMGRYGVCVNAVMPGFHVTPMSETVWEKGEPELREQHLLRDLPNRKDLGEFVYIVANFKTVTGQVFPFESRLV